MTTSTTSTAAGTFLSTAMEHIALGIPVIPIKAGQKAPPLTPGGTKDASLDLQQVTAWAERFPDANCGVVATLTGICIVDDDEGVVERSGISVSTRVVESSPGHRQYYFRQTAETAAVGNLQQRGGFSLRGHNFYGLAAGSKHPDGHLYRLFADALIAPMPLELLWHLQEVNATPTGAAGAKAGAKIEGSLLWLHEGEKIGEDEGRNDDMTRLAGLLWDGQVDEGEFVERLTWACELRHDPPYPESRIRELVERAMKEWKPSHGFDLSNLLPNDPEIHGYWFGMTVYRKKEDYEAAVGRAALAKEAEIAARMVNADDWAGLFHTFEEIDKAPPLSFAIHGWLQTEGITMYGGLPGHGKTLLGLSTVKALLTGEPLFGHDFFKVDKARRVLYLCPEVGRGPLSHRIKMFRLLPFVKSGELLVRTLSSPDVPLMDPRILKAAEGADVFLDTAVRFMEGEENSATEQRVFAKNLFTLLSAGARTVTGLHHSPKFAKGAETMSLENALRGTNELGAMLSTAWGTKLVDQETTRLYIQNLKPRDFDPVGAFTLEGRPHIDATGDFKVVDAPGEAGALKDHQPTKGLVDPEAGKEILKLKAAGKSISEISKDVGLSRSVVGRYVKEHRPS